MWDTQRFGIRLPTGCSMPERNWFKKRNEKVIVIVTLGDLLAGLGRARYAHS